MGKLKDLIIKTDEVTIAEMEAKINKLQNVEFHLRKKCHKYRKYIRGMEKGVKWRNEVITELLFRLGYEPTEVRLTTDDFRKLLDGIE